MSFEEDTIQPATQTLPGRRSLPSSCCPPTPGLLSVAPTGRKRLALREMWSVGLGPSSSICQQNPNTPTLSGLVTSQQETYSLTLAADLRVHCPGPDSQETESERATSAPVQVTTIVQAAMGAYEDKISQCSPSGKADTLENTDNACPPAPRGQGCLFCSLLCAQCLGQCLARSKGAIRIMKGELKVESLKLGASRITGHLLVTCCVYVWIFV